MKPGSLIGIWIAGVFAGAILGALTNVINGQVSPLYFRNIMGWHNVADISRTIVAQGIFEGLICGLALSTVFTVVVGIVSKASCPFPHGAQYLAYLMGLALVCWIIGGLLAMLLASLSPEFYMRAFIGVPEEAGPRLRDAWVGGSIWGIQFGGAAAVLVVAVLFGAGWKRKERTQQTHAEATSTTAPSTASEASDA